MARLQRDILSACFGTRELSGDHLFVSTMVHLASAGYIVIAPNYENTLVQTKNYVSYTSAQIIDGLAYAEKLDSITPARNEDGTYMFGLMGHSAGGVTLMNLASCWS